MRSLECSPPAKLNLVLRVLNRRRGPLHHVDTVMQTVAWRDELTLVQRNRPGVEMTVEGLRVGPVGENVAFQAAQAFLAAHRITDGLTIRLKKTIPAGAGLGGGSSDAASVLIGLNKLWQVGCTRRQLTPIAIRLGSDVPFFLWGGTARVEGTGERVTPWSSLTRGAILLVTFPYHLSTKEAYQTLDRQRARKRGGVKVRAGRDMMDTWRRAPKGGYPQADFHNDFLPIVKEKFRTVREAWELLEDASEGSVGMTGKGPTLFAWLPSASRARALAAVVKRSAPVARITIVSPLPPIT